LVLPIPGDGRAPLPAAQGGGNVAQIIAGSRAPTMSLFANLKPGLKGQSSLVVTDAMTAPRMGSGQIEVFASPMMIAAMEAAAIACIERHLPAGHASLGTHLDVAHSAPSPVGAGIVATAELISIDGRTVTFRVEARDEHEVIGLGTHTRVIVDIDRFVAKLARKRPPRG
jgi:predicted thioesterase